MLKGKAAVVTGSTSGIGLGVAKALAGEGVSVMLNGFGDPAEIEALRAGLAAETGVPVAYHPADVGDPDQVAALVAAAEQAFGSLDILVNNAGIQHTDPVERFPRERWDSIIAINLSAAFHATQAALPGMKARNWGRIVNIASAHALTASVNKAGYVAAKHGLLGLTKVVGLETAETGVTCAAICPGWVRTPLVEKQIEALAERDGTSIDQAVANLLGPKQPSKQFVTPEQIGGAVVFLCSPSASQMTGAALSIDGGWTAQ